MATTFFSVGTNLGNRKKNIEQAILLLKNEAGRCVKISDFYSSVPWGFVSENDFLNIVAEFETDLQPLELLDLTQSIERRIGRTHKTTDRNYSDRIIDIDILFYDSQIIDLPQLIIPHPLLHQRDFVLAPLAAIAPEWKHPVLQKTAADLAERR
ncbi:MAG: 2-amino-4-hydroxy-6-hydroxymethyldihydropteridine diphosphokinase [Prevotellaceae bacterium]|jgi:2-amino-4-hydroxy-6-hydroxymethyldihydropteridine diphosphokinase|nr:2-amino-4-hydroxy-6-hydroxymethyldihydropteridine diphosphokinase [Prevotellaceae bacterium]